MARPKSKSELIELCTKNFEKLLEYIDSLPEVKLTADFPPGTMNRNIRDVLAHLHQWHLMMLEWYEVGMSGQKPAMPAKAYTWKDLPELNKRIWQQYSNTPISKVRTLLEESYLKVFKLITRHSNEELFEKKRYPWTGSTSLGAYLISCTSSHYDWAFKLIKKATK